MDISSHQAWIAKLNRDFQSLKDSASQGQSDSVKMLIRIDTILHSLCRDMERSINDQESNYRRFEGIRKCSPPTIDTIVKNIPPAILHSYMCHQNRLIDGMWTFCNTATENNVKIFNLFKDDNIEHKWLEINNIKHGLCFGLSALFLLCSFISDRQKDKTVFAAEDDLLWFYKCIVLLQLGLYNHSLEQKKDLTRFISLVFHLQNSLMATGVSNHLFPDSMAPDGFKQSTNFVNSEFSGDHCIVYFYPYIEIEEEYFINTLLGSNFSLYVQFTLYSDNPNLAHAVSLHKSALGVFTFYDPSFAAINVELADKEDFLAFKNRYLLAKYDRFKVMFGISFPKQHMRLDAQQLVLDGTHVPSNNSSKKRLRINS